MCAGEITGVVAALYCSKQVDQVSSMRVLQLQLMQYVLSTTNERAVFQKILFKTALQKSALLQTFVFYE
jgi:hypothetical protein